MHEQYTPAVTRALELAHDLAGQQRESAVRPVHVLHGLLQDEEGRAWTLLAQAGLDPQAVRLSIPPNSSEGHLSLHESALEALELARELAHEYALERTVASEHLLLALLQKDADLCATLTAQGLRLAELEAKASSAQGPPLALDEPLDLADTTQTIELARLLDAGANRAREALRVLEDYCRFVLDDALLCRELKQLRHDLGAALDTLPGSLLLAARETLRDVGTAISTPTEQERDSLSHVLGANWKRVQEALRSLEEFGKCHTAELGQALEALRYRSYTLERALYLGDDARQRLADVRLCVLVTGTLCTGPLPWTILEAAAGGASMIQLREKELGDRDLLERAREVRRVTRQAGVLFILNNRPDLARLVQADGVHLGQDDMTIKDARRIVGPDALIGLSTHNLDQLRQAVLDGASYVGVGPTFASSTKTFEELAGLEYVKRASAETTLPAFVIGGMSATNVDASVAAGARRVAVSQAICAADSPRAAALEICRRLPV